MSDNSRILNLNSVGRYLFAYVQIGLAMNMFYYFFNVPSLLLGFGLGISLNRIHSVQEITNSLIFRNIVNFTFLLTDKVLHLINKIKNRIFNYTNNENTNYENTNNENTNNENTNNLIQTEDNESDDLISSEMISKND